jgi:hypothetical protein
VLKVLIPGLIVLAIVWMVEIPKEWLPGKNARQIKAEQEKEAAAKAAAERKAADAVAVRRFADPAGLFEIDFPGPPAESNVSGNQFPVPNIFSSAGKTFTKTHDGIKFEARWERWHVVAKTPNERLDFMKPKLLSGPGFATPRVTAVESAQGVKGFEASGVYEDQPRKYKMKRVFLVPEQDGIDRYYSATVSGPADWLPNEKARAFIESFELTDTAALYPLPGAPGK